MSDRHFKMHWISDRQALIYMLFLSVTTFLIYSLNLSDEFIHSMDDDWGIYANPLVQNLSIENLKKIWFGDTMDVYYIPLTFSAFAFEVALWGNDPYLFKLFSLTIFTGSGWVLYNLLNKLKISRTSVLFTISLYLLHPFQVENIAWAASTRQVLSMFFLLLTCTQIISAGTVYDDLNKRRYYTALAFFFLALAAKFTAVVFVPLYVCVYILYAMKYSSTLSQAKNHLIRLIPFLIVGVFFYLMNLKTLRSNFMEQDLNYSFLQHILIILGSFGFYVKQIFTGPFSFLYPITPHDQFEYATYFGYSAITILVVLITVGALFRKSFIFSGAGLWFLITLTPSALLVFLMSDIPANTADRYFTMASPGIFLIIAIFTEKLFKQLTPFLVIILICILSYFTIQQVKIWHNVFPLFEHNISHYPSEEFYHRLAIEHFKKGENQQAFRLLEQADHLNRNIRFNNPFFFDIELAYIYQLKGDAQASKQLLAELLLRDLEPTDNVDHTSLIRENVNNLFPLSSDMNTNYKNYISLRSGITASGKMTMRPHRI